MQKLKMKKTEEKLYNSKSPAEYIDNSLKVKLSPSEKARITRLWLEKTGFTIEEIQHARNIHPYWKKKKMEGSYERNEYRKLQHDYSTKGTVEWNEKSITEFIKMNGKDKSGKYTYKDHELARHFNSTIPGIQHYRRKYNMAIKILDNEKTKPTVKRIYNLITQSEQILRRQVSRKKRK